MPFAKSKSSVMFSVTFSVTGWSDVVPLSMLNAFDAQQDKFLKTVLLVCYIFSCTLAFLTLTLLRCAMS